MHTPIAVLLALAGTAFAQVQPRVDAPSRVPVRELAARDAKEHLPIKRITLYRSGVNSVERRGLVDGDASVQLRFTTEQVNDILKSMIVLDLSKGKGRIEGISYASKEPLARRLASFGIDVSDNPAAGEILQRLRGTAVKLTTVEGAVSGTIMNVETRPTVYQGKDGAVVHQLPWINLVTPTGVQSVNLTTVTGFEVLDKPLAEELNKALAALAEYRADRTKTVEVNLVGEGAREIVIAYVQEAPVWKTSYRLVLPDLAPEKPDAKPAPGRLTLQGWAIVENTTDEDWRDVGLSLVAGRPVSFRMDLYEPLYVYRPEIPVPTVPGVLPRQYAGGADFKDAPEFDLSDAITSTGQGRNFKSKSMETRSAGRVPGSPTVAPMPPPASAMDGAALGEYAAQAQARGVDAGEVFQFELEHAVTVERQRSAMLPIINSGIDGRRVSIFNPADGSEHPMRGVEITNSTDLQLMPGPIAVFDGGSYAGDAQIGHVPKGDKRLLAYAVDLDLDQTRKDKADSALRKVRIVRGLLETTHLNRSTTEHIFTSKDLARGRTLVLEVAKQPGWTLGEAMKPSQETPELYRFELAVPPGKSAVQAVVFERVEGRTIALTSVDLPTMMSYSQQGKVSEKVMQAFREAARLQGAVGGVQSRINALEKERQEIDADQGRIRQNMTNAIDRQSELFKRYMAKLTEQETRLEVIAAELSKARADLQQAQADLAQYLSELDVE